MTRTNLYAILSPIPRSDAAIWSRVVQSKATARRSVDGLSCLVRWPDGMEPPDADKTRVGGRLYTYDEIREILAGPEWTPEVKPEPDDDARVP